MWLLPANSIEQTERSETEARRGLEGARRAALSGDSSEGCASDCGVRVGQIWVVEGVVAICPELKINALPDLKMLYPGKVPLRLPIPADAAKA